MVIETGESGTKSGFELEAGFVQELFQTYREGCHSLAESLDRSSTSALRWPSPIAVLIGELRIEEKILRTLGLDIAVDQVREDTLVKVCPSGLAAHSEFWELMNMPEKIRAK